MPELTIIERVQKALSIEHTEAQLKAMAKKSADIKEIKDDTDYQLVKSSRITLKGVRVDIQKAGKAARDDANKFSRAVIAEEKRLVNIISPEETRLQALQTEVDKRAEREAEALRQAEEARVADIIDEIQGIKEMAEGLLGAPASEIIGRIQTLDSVQYDESTFGEYTEQAIEVVIQTKQTLSDAYKQRKDLEEQQAEQARIAKEQAERQAEMDRQAEEQRKQQEAEQARIDAQAADLKRKQDKIDAKLKAEEDRKLAEERAEAERVRKEKERLEQEEADRIRKEEAARLQAEEDARQEALRPEKDRLIDWLKKLRFIDGVELHDKNLIAIQESTLSGLKDLSEEGIQVVEDA